MKGGIKKAQFVTEKLIFLQFESDYFLFDLDQSKVISHFNDPDLGIGVFRLSLSPNAERLVLSNSAGNAILWDTKSGQVRELGDSTLNSPVLGWLNNNTPIFSSPNGGAATIDLMELLQHDPDEQFYGLSPGYRGVKYDGEELYRDDMLMEVEVECYANVLYIKDGNYSLFEVLNGSFRSINKYTISKEDITHEVLETNLDSMEYPHMALSRDRVAVIAEGNLHVFDINTFSFLNTYKFPMREYDSVIVQGGLPEGQLYTYNKEELLQWDLESGQNKEVWRGKKLKGFSVLGNTCIIYTEKGPVEAFDIRTGDVLFELKVAGSGIKVSKK